MAASNSAPETHALNELVEASRMGLTEAIKAAHKRCDALGIDEKTRAAALRRYRHETHKAEVEAKHEERDEAKEEKKSEKDERSIPPQDRRAKKPDATA